MLVIHLCEYYVQVNFGGDTYTWVHIIKHMRIHLNETSYIHITYTNLISLNGDKTFVIAFTIRTNDLPKDFT